MESNNIASRFLQEYWDYYLMLERDLIDTFRYVELDKINWKTYSREYQSLLSTIGSEVDVAGKSIAEIYAPDNKKISEAPIATWGYFVQQNLPCIEKACVETSRGQLIQPWKNWQHEPARSKTGAERHRLVKGRSNPEWWTAYNKTKHRRKSLVRPEQSSYERANLSNVVSALAGLYVLEQLFFTDIAPLVGQSARRSNLFKLI